MEQLLGFLLAHRRALARLLLVAGVLVVGDQLWPVWPQTTSFDLDLGQQHREVVELRMSFLQQGTELRGVTLHFEAGAPARVRHEVMLPGGTVELACELRDRAGRSHTQRQLLRLPAQGTLRVSLTPRFSALATSAGSAECAGSVGRGS